MLTLIGDRTIATFQGVISVNKPLDQPRRTRTVRLTVTATDNWNGTTDIKRVAYVPVRHARYRLGRRRAQEGWPPPAPEIRG